MFKHTYETRYGDYKDNETISVGCILDLVQDISTRHSKDLGYDIYKLKEMNIAWLIAGFNAEFFGKVKPYSPIDISTAVRTMKGVTSERGCIIEQDGKVVAKTVTNWFTFDTQKAKICKIPPSMCESYPIHDFEDEFFCYKKAETHDDAQRIYETRVCNKEIDTNGHLNNQKSALLLMDALPYDFEIKKMSVVYKKSVLLGERLFVCTKILDNGMYVHLASESGEICVAGVFEPF